MRKKRDMMQNWPYEAKKIVLRNISNADFCVIMSDSKTGTYAKSHPIDRSARLVISYIWPKDIFVVWNAAVHAYIHNEKGMTTLSIGKENEHFLDESFDSDAIVSVYKTVKQPGICDCVEMVLIVGKEALFDFCKNVDEYLFPNVDTIPLGKKCLYATPGGELERIDRTSFTSSVTIRERERIERAKRTPNFRKRVLDKWGNRCIVCGTTEERILEAAHQESVKAGGSDDPQNSFCLCANHHRMYDRAILDIDIDSGKFECHSDSVKQMAWYEQAEKRGFRLFLPGEEN